MAVTITPQFMVMVPLLWPFVETLGGSNRLEFEESAWAGRILAGGQTNVSMISITLGDILFLLLTSLLRQRKVCPLGASHSHDNHRSTH